MYLLRALDGHRRDQRHDQQDAPDCLVRATGSFSRWAYEGEVEQWAEKEEVERERKLAGMTGSLEQLAGLEEKEEEEESGPSVHGSENCLREY